MYFCSLQFLKEGKSVIRSSGERKLEQEKFKSSLNDEGLRVRVENQGSVKNAVDATSPVSGAM